jgi:hypothetical protein
VAFQAKRNGTEAVPYRTLFPGHYTSPQPPRFSREIPDLFGESGRETSLLRYFRQFCYSDYRMSTTQSLDTTM